MGATLVAPSVEDVPVAGHERAGGDEVGGVLVAGESEPHSAAVRREPQARNGGFGVAMLGALLTAVHHAAAPCMHDVECHSIFLRAGR